MALISTLYRGFSEKTMQLQNAENQNQELIQKDKKNLFIFGNILYQYGIWCSINLILFILLFCFLMNDYRRSYLINVMNIIILILYLAFTIKIIKQLHRWAESTNHPRFLRISKKMGRFIMIQLVTIFICLIEIELFTYPSKNRITEGTLVNELMIILILLSFISISEIIDFSIVLELECIINLWNLDYKESSSARKVFSGIQIYKFSKTISCIPVICFLGIFIGNIGKFRLSNGLKTIYFRF